MSLILKGMGSSPKLIVVGFGPKKLPVFIDEDDIGGTIATTLRHKDKTWLDQAWWLHAKSYSVKASLLEINGREILLPSSNKVTKIVYPEEIRVKVRLKWIKRLKDSTRNIFINALRIIRGDK